MKKLRLEAIFYISVFSNKQIVGTYSFRWYRGIYAHDVLQYHVSALKTCSEEWTSEETTIKAVAHSLFLVPSVSSFHMRDKSMTSWLYFLIQMKTATSASFIGNRFKSRVS